MDMLNSSLCLLNCRGKLDGRLRKNILTNKRVARVVVEGEGEGEGEGDAEKNIQLALELDLLNRVQSEQFLLFR